VPLLLSALLILPGACARVSPPTASVENVARQEEETPLFRDVTALAGVSFTYHNGEEADQYSMLELPGGGLAVLDFDNDGRLDLFLAGGGSFAGPNHQQIKGRPCKLYRNVTPPGATAEDWRFEDVTSQVGLDGIDYYTHGAAVADFDNDGWPDLLVTGWGRLALYRNVPVDANDGTGSRKFVDVSNGVGLPPGLWTTSAAWGDLDGDGYPDLYVCQYVDWSFERNHPTDCSLDGGKTRDICIPKRFLGREHKLFHNCGGRRFADVSKSAGLRVARTEAEYDQLGWLDASARQRLRQSVSEGHSRFGAGLGVVFVDVNGDGKPDIYVANDMADNFLYFNRTAKPGTIQLEEKGLESGTALNANGLPDGSMGVDAADFDGSGRASLWVTNYAGELHALYRNQCRKGNEFFQHFSVRAGLASAGQGRVGWGTGFVDLDHDGWEDLFLIAGDVYRHNPDIPRAQLPALFRNHGGKFLDISARGGSYFTSRHVGRGAVLADFDNDGRIDLAMSHVNEPVTILRNETNTMGRHWLGVELKGADQRDVVGARIVLEAGGRKQTRFAKGGGSCLSSSDRRHVFGLGSADHFDRLRVIWPSGKEQQWTALALDRYWRLIEGQQQALPSYPNK
jgi:hypothetical protein